MLYWALVFLIVALVAGGVGFGGVAVAFAGLAKDPCSSSFWFSCSCRWLRISGEVPAPCRRAEL
jgi:hypothetical protein